uniref:Uncharacterized protein n=1 Tax=Anguilla anguilla TaxID=7936 RepID=A0A0E9XV41_ANGAN
MSPITSELIFVELPSEISKRTSSIKIFRYS